MGRGSEAGGIEGTRRLCEGQWARGEGVSSQDRRGRTCGAGQKEVSSSHNQVIDTVKEMDHQMKSRYFLSLDPRLEEGWVYRADLLPGDRFDLINELGVSCGTPDIRGVARRRAIQSLVERVEVTLEQTDATVTF